MASLPRNVIFTSSLSAVQREINLLGVASVVLADSNCWWRFHVFKSTPWEGTKTWSDVPQYSAHGASNRDYCRRGWEAVCLLEICRHFASTQCLNLPSEYKSSFSLGVLAWACDLVHLVCRPLLFHNWMMAHDECRAVDGMGTDTRSRSTRRKSAPVPFYPPQTRLCGLAVRVPGYITEMYCDSCEVRTEFTRIYVM
jgi:hypothetical protein